MIFFVSDSKWKLIAVLAILFMVASVYLYSTDPAFVNGPEFQQLKASVYNILDTSDANLFNNQIN